MDHEDYLSRLLPRRLDALAIGVLMLNLRLKWQEPKPIQIFVDGRLQFEGRTSLFLNPILEVGVLHARALLEFIGLKSTAGQLSQLDPKTRNRDDAAIEKLVGPSGTLPLVTPDQVGAMHPNDPHEAEQALVRVIVAAHKGVAHSSSTYFTNPASAKEILLAFQLTQELVEAYVYRPLGRVRPLLPIQERVRDE